MPDLTGLPASLRRHARWVRLADVPALVVHPEWTAGVDRPRTRPWLLWLHGRTVNKELDPGRYQRLARVGIASVAVDLPGHGERFDASFHSLERTLDLVATATGEIDAVVDAAVSDESLGLGHESMAIGGMSAGGMATLARLCRPHRFGAALVECATGSWRWQPNLAGGDAATFGRLNPIDHVDGWRPIPLLALHNRLDEWVPLEGQEEFLATLRARTSRPDLVRLHVYDRTGAPHEHAGFGTMGSDAKDRAAAHLAVAMGIRAAG